MCSSSRSEGCSPELESQVLQLFLEDLPRADLRGHRPSLGPCLLYTSDAADERK